MGIRSQAQIGSRESKTTIEEKKYPWEGGLTRAVKELAEEINWPTLKQGKGDYGGIADGNGRCGMNNSRSKVLQTK